MEIIGKMYLQQTVFSFILISLATNKWQDDDDDELIWLRLGCLFIIMMATQECDKVKEEHMQ